MTFSRADTFLRRLALQTHFRRSKDPAGFVLSDGVFKRASVPIPGGRLKTSVDHECQDNSLVAVLSRWRDQKPGCGIARIEHSAIAETDSLVYLDPENGNDFHCSLEFLDDMKVAFHLAQSCLIAVWPSEIPEPDRIRIDPSAKAL